MEGCCWGGGSPGHEERGEGKKNVPDAGDGYSGRTDVGLATIGRQAFIYSVSNNTDATKAAGFHESWLI
jgi:hypothetical protein